MEYGLIYYPNTSNLGDDIQTYATELFLPKTDYLIDRESLDSFYSADGSAVKVIMSG